MNVDNSGANLILDPQSQIVIDAIRDRITLLESEGARLGKLKTNLDDAVRKTEADLAYKNTLLENASSDLDAAMTKLNDVIATEVEASNSVNDMNLRLKTSQKDMDEQADALSVREKIISANEASLAIQASDLAVIQAQVNIDTTVINTKKDAIQALITSL